MPTVCISRSCISQTILVMEEWSRNLDDDAPVGTIYLDFKKVFDAVAHERLVITLERHGISGNLPNWMCVGTGQNAWTNKCEAWKY